MLRLTLLGSLLIATGCSRTPSVAPPKFNASGVASKAMDLCDSDSDGVLTETELKASPGLLAGMKTIDSDGDKKLSREEIETRIKDFVESETGALIVECRFMQGSKPVANAEVIFEPEPFLEGVIVPAKGETDARGMTSLTCPATPIGVQQGFYRVSINDGKLPAKYNTETELGAEVSGSSDGNKIGIYEFKL